MMHWNYLDSLRNALNRHPTSKAKKPPVFCRFPSVENSSPIHIFHRRPHNDTRTNASNVSSFNQILRSLFTQFGLENPRSYIVVLAKPKLQSVLSQSCRVEIARVIGIWNCLLECQDWSPPVFLFTNCNHCILWHAIFEEAFIVTSGNFAKHIHVKCPKTKKNIFDGQNDIWQVLKTSILKTWATPTDGIFLLITMALNCGAYGNFIGNPLSCCPVPTCLPSLPSPVAYLPPNAFLGPPTRCPNLHVGVS